VQGDLAAIDAGVKPGELVVVDGASALREGSKVDVKVAPATAAALSPP
jgi:multidrug efflux pump subunit AcrA (membrane-fusion protein)